MPVMDKARFCYNEIPSQTFKKIVFSKKKMFNFMKAIYDYKILSQQLRKKVNFLVISHVTRNVCASF